MVYLELTQRVLLSGPQMSKHTLPAQRDVPAMEGVEGGFSVHADAALSTPAGPSSGRNTSDRLGLLSAWTALMRINDTS